MTVVEVTNEDGNSAVATSDGRSRKMKNYKKTTSKQANVNEYI